MGYHKVSIPRGQYGAFDKIIEEFHELQDAHKQQIRIMELCELADLVGAVEGYVEQQFGMKLDDVLQMMQATKRAFQDGSRR